MALVPAEFVLPPVLDEEPPLLTLELPAALAPATDVPPPPPELVAAESSLLLLQPQSNVISVIEPTVFTSLRIRFPSRAGARERWRADVTRAPSVIDE